jgi:hypothetical protein
MLASTMQFSNNQHSRKQPQPFPENPTARPARPDNESRSTPKQY